MEPECELAYKTVIEYRSGERDLLFERLNYFLVGSAFLAAAYVTLAALKPTTNYPALFYLAYLINGAGFYLSLFFAIVNNLNSKILGRLDLYIRELESESLNVRAFTHIQNRVIKDVFEEDFHRNNALCLIAGPVIGLCKFIGKPFD